jgi:hypothetical protein
VNEERRRIADGIEIDREVAEQAGLPEELDAGIVGPYRFPDPRRRKVAGWMYVGTAVIVGLLAIATPGYWIMAGLLLVLAVWHLRASWKLGIEQEEALDLASKVVPFAVGHASAAITFHGLRARPRWQVIAYSADEPPTRRALVEFDAVSGDQMAEPYVENVPT